MAPSFFGFLTGNREQFAEPFESLTVEKAISVAPGASRSRWCAPSRRESKSHVFESVSNNFLPC
jgi:hypothetical protein